MSNPAFAPDGGSVLVTVGMDTWTEQRVVAVSMEGKVLGETDGYAAGWLSNDEALVVRFDKVARREPRVRFSVLAWSVKSGKTSLVANREGVAALHCSGWLKEQWFLYMAEQWYLAGADLALPNRPGDLYYPVPCPVAVDGTLFMWHEGKEFTAIPGMNKRIAAERLFAAREK